MADTGYVLGARDRMRFQRSRVFRGMPSLATVPIFALIIVFIACRLTAQTVDSAELDASFKKFIQPLLVQHCYECHSGDLIEGEIDLTDFGNIEQIRQQTAIWQKINEMLTSEQMPPLDSPQPSADERAALVTWVQSYLKLEAAVHAGDPGPVLLRRLNNVEYTYTLQDLTRIADLNVAREFPVDSASGEGFTNVGNSLVMSPSLLTKYLDAAKEVSSHAVLLPTGMRFSPSNSRRDWTNEYLAEIRSLYSRYTDSGGGTAVDLQGIQFDTNRGGRLPVEKYLLATIEDRESLAAGIKSIETVARERGLSSKYLGNLWTMLNDADSSSFLLDPLRAKWKSAGVGDASQLMALITPWQEALFRFNSVGQIGLHENITSWLVPVSPLAGQHEFRIQLPNGQSGEILLSLQADDVGDGSPHNQVVWEHPRFVAPGRPDALLKDLVRVADELTECRDRYFAQAAKCLTAAGEAEQSDSIVELESLTKKHGLDIDALAIWLDYLGVANNGITELGTPISEKQERFAGFDFIQGWVGDDSLGVLANSSDQAVRIPGNMRPNSVAVHPAPTQSIAVGWRSPINGSIRISGTIEHAHPECGNGTGWSLELRRGRSRRRLAAGTSQGSTIVPVGPFELVAVRPGDVVAMVISPQDGNHSCDLTAVDLTLNDGKREWNLWKDVAPQILAGNPHADSFGNAGVWHFFSEPTSDGKGYGIPVDSCLAKWQAATDPVEKQRLVDEVQIILQSDPASFPLDSPDRVLVQQLPSIAGPFMWAIFRDLIGQPTDPATVSESKWRLPMTRFGKCPDGTATESMNLGASAPDSLSICLPAELVAGSEFVVSGGLHPVAANDGSVRLTVQATGLSEAQRSVASPLIVNPGTAAAARIESNLEEFRRLFPPALCYDQIVPVDETVTLILYYREDERLQRLMLTPAEKIRLDQLWEELFYISQEPLEMVTVFDQLYQFATQDRADLLPAFEPLRKPVQDRAAAFRQRLLDDQPQQLDALIDVATTAYRRPLAQAEVAELRGLYASLRQQELTHEAAFRLTLARVLVAPAFLYRLESPNAGQQAAPVSEYELASRLSYFLWSSAPDAELLDLAASNKLHDPEVLVAQAKRMLVDDKARRMAIEFGCHWLHIHDFDNLNEKSAQHFPTFAALRSAMYEESILVLTDLFQHDRSLISLIDSDVTFLNEALAMHYDIPGITGAEFRRVDGVRQYSRGSILALATTMAKQSGASRTSPILRGTWLSEVILGEKLPRPPKNVPVLSETLPVGLTERQLVAHHTSDPACARCHRRIDPYGFALEGFDAIGRLRLADAGGLPIDTKTVLYDGTAVEGLQDLQRYVGTTRREAFVGQFTRKLLGYAVGRSVQLSDEPLLDTIEKQLIQNDYRVGVAIEAIVRSPQFREIRGQEFPLE